MPDHTEPAARREVAAALDACGGDKDAALLLLLAHLLTIAKRGMCAGFLHHGTNSTGRV